MTAPDHNALDRAAGCLLEAVSYSWLDNPDAPASRAAFLKKAAGIERTALVARAAELLAPIVDAAPAITEQFLWFALDLYFDIVNVAALEPRGSA